MKTSVVIPCYNSREVIPYCLQALRKQSQPPHEIIVVDSSIDGTDDLIRKTFPEVRLIHLEKQTMPGAGRNLGLRESEGDLVLFTDTDAVPASDWVEHHQRIHAEDPSLCILGGAILNHNPDTYWSRLAFYSEFTGYGPHDQAGARPVVPSVNMSIKKSLALLHDLSMPENALPGGEDVFICQDALDKGQRVGFDPAPAVGHINRNTASAYFGHMKSSGYAGGRVAATYDIALTKFVSWGPFAVWLAPVRCLLVLKRNLRPLKTLLDTLWMQPLMLWGMILHMWAFQKGARSVKDTP